MESIDIQIALLSKQVIDQRYELLINYKTHAQLAGNVHAGRGLCRGRRADTG